MNLSPNFTLHEMTRSATAAKYGIKNIPNASHVENLRLLCTNILQPLRDLLGVPVTISSGYRCKALNRIIGGARNSQHQTGRAADLSVKGFTTEQLFQLIVDSNLEYDQVIEEFGEWIHISFSEKPRKIALIAKRVNGRVIYTTHKKI